MKWGTALLLEDPEGHSINAYMFNKIKNNSIQDSPFIFTRFMSE